MPTNRDRKVSKMTPDTKFKNFEIKSMTAHINILSHIKIK